VQLISKFLSIILANSNELDVFRACCNEFAIKDKSCRLSLQYGVTTLDDISFETLSTGAVVLIFLFLVLSQISLDRGEIFGVIAEMDEGYTDSGLSLVLA
jgi:hypothetical protein